MKGVHPKIIPEMLGHSSIAIILDTYGHVIPGLGAAASEMEEALKRLAALMPRQATFLEFAYRK